MEIGIRGTSDLAARIPPAGKIEIAEQATVGDVLRHLGIDSDLVMLFVVDGDLVDTDRPLDDGETLELIAPISGG